MGLNELRQIHAFFNRRVYKWISCLYASNGIMNQDMLCFIRRRVCKSKLSFFLLLTAKYILMNQDMLCFIRRRVCKSKLSFFLLLTAKYILILCLWMRKGKSDFLSFFKFFTTCLVPCVFSITCPLAKEMSSILTTAYCP